ncbi:MAG: hypothetical protein NC203_08170 [Firmicutes bacterium]|nr:hypothetical protein [Bacillota bacterium]
MKNSMGNNLRQIFSVAKTQFVGWIADPRMIILAVLLLVIKILAIDPLSARAIKFGDSMIVFEAFISVGNSGVLTLFIPTVFLVLLSDYPKLKGNSLFLISRTGKVNWFLGQLLFLLMSIVSFLGIILIFSAAISAFSGGVFGTQWSDAVTKYNAKFPEEIGSFDGELLPPNLYNQIPMMTALFQTFVLMAMYLFMLSLIVYFFKMLLVSSAGLAAALAVIALGLVTTSLYSPLRWAFPMANTIMWLHYEEILREPIYPVWCSFAYFGAAVLLLTGSNLAALKSLRFTENSELG